MSDETLETGLEISLSEALVGKAEEILMEQA
jgi:hypothetical protein